MAKGEPKTEKKEEKKEKPLPSKVGDELGGYKLAAQPVAGRYLLETKGSRYGVYTKPWTKDAAILLRPTAEMDVALSVLQTGKMPEKPKAKKEDAPVKKEASTKK
jgi:hypothetical protein